jgi:hypothetical protein
MELLKKMLTTPSVSGSELHFQKMLIEEMKDIDDFVITHHSYNVIHGINKESNVKIMLLAHIDEIGLVIEDVEEKIGHPVGGVCPFAVNPDVIVYLDESLKRFKYVYPACGSSNSAIKLTISELENNLRIYPNPANDYIKISAVGSQLSVVKIYNYLGILIDEIETNSEELEINISNYNSGVYFVEINTEKENSIIRIIKK